MQKYKNGDMVNIVIDNRKTTASILSYWFSGWGDYMYLVSTFSGERKQIRESDILGLWEKK